MSLSPTFKARCEAIATRFRAELALKAYDSLPGGCLAKHLRVVVITPTQLPDFCEVSPEVIEYLCHNDLWSAALLGEEPSLILMHPRSAIARVESNIMHELAHFILCHESVGWNAIGMPVRRAEDEKEAEYLGGCLQIPRRGLLWAKQKDLTVYETARHYGASQEMVRYRCNMIGVSLH